jgi:hypothetical protein
MAALKKSALEVDYVPKHVCLKKSCVFCMVQAGRAVPKEHVVRFMSHEKRTMIDELLDLLPALDEHQLQALNYVVKGFVASVPVPKPYTPERRKRPRLVVSNPPVSQLSHSLIE